MVEQKTPTKKSSAKQKPAKKATPKAKKAVDGAVSYKLTGADGKEAGTIDLDPAIFGAEIFSDLVHLAVRWQRARKHRGTHATINKAKYKGGSRKPHAQKGTGQARAGGADSPLWVGGAVAHGPQPKDTYAFRFARRSRRQALTSILTYKAQANELVVLKNLSIKEGKTKELRSVLKHLGLDEQKVTLLVATGKHDPAETKVWQAAGNLPNVRTIPVSGVNAFDLLNASVVLSTADTIKALEQRLSTEAAK